MRSAGTGSRGRCGGPLNFIVYPKGLAIPRRARRRRREGHRSDERSAVPRPGCCVRVASQSPVTEMKRATPNRLELIGFLVWLLLASKAHRHSFGRVALPR